MDPLTAISLASNIISFIDFGAKLFNSAQEIYGSASGATANALSYGSIMREMEIFSTKLIPPDGQLSGYDRAICDLAKECKVLATDIQKLLEKAKPKDSNSRLHSFVSAVKAQKYDKQRGELQARLENCRSQLSLQLSYMTGSELKDKLDLLVSSSKEHGDRAVQLQRHVQELHDRLKAITSSDGQNQLQKLLQMSETTFHDLVNQRIIESLAFDDMYGRFDAVAPAHAKTFEWIFHGDEEPEESAMKQHLQNDPYRSMARRSFLSWLSSGHGLFHISGKLGSGKSTLMKFLWEDSRTKKVLNEWASDGTLVMASFFFWKPGSKLQKSMDGLLRALLHESLQAVPNLVPDIFPEQWNEMVSAPWRMHTKLTFRSQDLREAFNRLICSQTDNLRFCFFIDGLDEYEETFQDDNQSMIKKLRNWGEKASGNVKICVSSREYNVFMNSLPAERRICMQNLTEKDMFLYVKEKVDFVHDPEQMGKLVESITSKADGIFLWVALVTKRLRDLNEHGVSFQRISEEIDQCPRGLEELFNHIILSLDPSDKERAYKTFSIVRFLQKYKFSLPLLGYAFIDDDNADPDRETMLLQARTLAAMSEEELVTRARKMLRGYCKGLIEETTSKFDDMEVPIISFTHRSVPEFLEQFFENAQEALQKFDSPRDISQILLKYLWAKDTSEHYIPSHFAGLSNVSYVLLKVRWDAGIGKEPFYFEEQLDLALARLGAQIIPEHDNYTEYRVCHANDMMSMIAANGELEGEYFCICGSFMLAAWIGEFKYMKWKLSRSPSFTSILTILFYSVFTGFEPTNRGILEILDLLLERGLSPQTATAWAPYWNSLEGPELNIWQHIILFPLQWGISDEWILECSFFWEWLLKNGADPHFEVSIPCQSIGSRTRRLEVTLIIGKERRRITLSTDTNFPKQISSQEYPDPEGDGILITLTDIINICDFDNKDKLFSLIERNTRCLQEASGEVEEALRPEKLSKEYGGGGSPEKKRDTEPTSINQEHGRPDSDKTQSSMLLRYLLGIVSAVLVVRLISFVTGIKGISMY